MRLPILLVALGACSFSTGPVGAGGDDAAGSDAGGSDATGSDSGMGSDSGSGSDSGVTGPFCYGTYHPICLVSQPTAAYEVTETLRSIDTGGNGCMETTAATGAGVCVLAGTSVSIPTGKTLRVHGKDRALVLIATTGTIEIAGIVDVATRVGSNQGAGNGLGPCVAGEDALSAGGGAGGSFGGLGGNGGDDGFGTRGLTNFPVNHALRGGCPGGAGGSSGGAGGGGGGAVLLSSPSVIQISGIIDASGAGGSGGPPSVRGGGGGGSGGMIYLEANVVQLSGILWADGGGGGEGAGVAAGTNGDSGAPQNPANGGDGLTSGGSGGAGSQGGQGFVGGDGSANVGGGGGGGTGIIRATNLPAGFTINTASATVSPPFSQ